MSVNQDAHVEVPNIYNILYYMLSVTLLVDYVNGAFYGMHIGEIFRIALLLVSIGILWKNDHTKILIVGTIFCFLLLNILLSTMLDGRGLKYNISIAGKSCLFFIVTQALLESNKKAVRVNPEKLFKTI